MTRNHIRLSVLILLLAFGAQSAMSQQVRPYTYDDLKGYVGNVGDTVLTRSVADRRVSFEPTAAQIAELRKLGASDRLIAAIRDNPAPGTLQIVCKPVDCEFSVVSTSPQWNGKTERGEASYELLPGTYGVEVLANGYVAQTSIVSVGLGRTEKKEFNLAAIPLPPMTAMPPTTGTVVVNCGAEVAECAVRLDDGIIQSTNGRQAEFTTVSPGDHRIELSAHGFQTQAVTISISVGRNVIPIFLRADTQVDPQGIFDQIEKALGGEKYFTQAQVFQAESRKDGLILSDGEQTKAHYVESLLGQRIRWDITLPNSRFWSGGVNLNASNTSEWWANDKTGSAVRMGQDLNRGLHAYEALRPSELIPMLRDVKYKKELLRPGELTIGGPDGVFQISYDEKSFLPMRVQSAPAGGGLMADIRFSGYTQSGVTALPCTMEIRFPERPAFSLRIVYLRYLLMPNIIKSDFNKNLEKVEAWNKQAGNVDVVYCPEL
jgi:hypothetical protein